MKSRSGALVLCSVLGAILLGCSDGADRDPSGLIVGEGKIGVFDFEVGDCFLDTPDMAAGMDVELSEVEGVPCNEEHHNEVIALYDLSADFEDWPGEAEVDRVAEAACLNAFPPYVGRDYETSRFHFAWISPSPDSWELNDDRQIVCYLYALEKAKVTGSMRDSGE